MTIRPATEQDLPAMLQLSKESLGELAGMRTEEYWRWKHTQNPFGCSPVLLASKQDTLIGLRAFMRWRFCYQGKSIDAFRAVDTATHPEHRGQGIFSTLTVALIDQVTSGTPSIIFNTPNSKSMPGYLKMGWKEVGKTRLRVKVHPVNMVQHRFGNKTTHRQPEPFTLPDDIDSLLNTWKQSQTHQVISEYHPDYLRWRYQQIPVLKYGMHLSRQGNSACMIMYRLKQSNALCELRLTEVIYVGTERKAVVQRAIQELSETYQPGVITVLADAAGELDAMLPVGFFPAEKRGLTITGRKVNDEGLESLLLNYKEWYLSAGTLELF